MTQQFDDALPGTFDDVTEFTPAFDDGTYVLTVVRLEATDGQFGEGLKWVFTMVNQATGQQVMTPGNGALTPSGRPEPYSWFQFSSKKVTPRTKVYPWLTAFLGRTPEIGESGSKLVKAVIGKSAIAMVGVPATDPGGRQKILTIKPCPSDATPKYSSTGEDIESSSTPAVPADLMAELEDLRKMKAAQNQAAVAAAGSAVSEESYKALFGADGVPA